MAQPAALSPGGGACGASSGYGRVKAHHDVELQDKAGPALVPRRLANGIAGIAVLHALIAKYLACGRRAGWGRGGDPPLWASTALLARRLLGLRINSLSASSHGSYGKQGDHQGSARAIASLRLRR